jgi:hypothetical protein
LNTLTEYLDRPVSHALAKKYGAKLESLTAPDKIDLAHAVLTTAAYSCESRSDKTIATTIEEFGTVADNATQSEGAISLIDSITTDNEERLAIAAALCHQLYKGVYADAE